jgi:hypothetical protein
LSAFSTTPSIGARTSVRDRSSRALSTAAWAWAIDGCSPGAIAALALAAGGEAPLQQRLLAGERILLDLEVGLRADDVAAGARRLGLELRRLQPGVGELGLGLLERDLEGLRVDAEQQLAALHPGPVAHEHGHDLPVHLRAHRDDVLLHLRVVGRHAAARGQPVIAAAEQQQGRDDEHQQGPREALEASRGRALQLGSFGFRAGQLGGRHPVH